eukprot:COSAG06_NODE_950_length_11350_cov_12.434984_2_plen_184_part_00
MYEYYAVLQTEMEDLQPSGAPAPAPAPVAAPAPAAVDPDEVEALWTELSTLQTTVTDGLAAAAAAAASSAPAPAAPVEEPAAQQAQQVAELEVVVDVLDDTVAKMAEEVGKRMELTEAACLSRVEWLDRRICTIEGKSPQPVSQLTGHLDPVKVLAAAAAAAGGGSGVDVSDDALENDEDLAL